MQHQRVWRRGGICMLGRCISTVVLRRLGKQQLARVGCEEGESVGEERKRKPHGYWREGSNRKHFLQAVADRLGVRSEGDWAFVTKRDLCSAGGRALLQPYASVQELVKAELSIVRVQH